jgi:hypothetical protein
MIHHLLTSVLTIWPIIGLTSEGDCCDASCMMPMLRSNSGSLVGSFLSGSLQTMSCRKLMYWMSFVSRHW